MNLVPIDLGDNKIGFNNLFDYSFLVVYLYVRTWCDFSYRKIILYTRNEEAIIGTKIVLMIKDSLKKIIENKVKDKYLY